MTFDRYVLALFEHLTLGITTGGNPWIGSQTTMPKGCNLQKTTNLMVFNTGEGGLGHHDLAPVCKLTETAEPSNP